MAELEDRFRLGEWWVDVSAGELVRGGERRRIEPKPMAVLQHLVRHAGRPVAKDELFRAVWPDTFVGEDSVWRSIYSLRQALGDMGPEKRYIETVPKRGYRVVAEVGRASPPGPGTAAPLRASRRLATATGLIACALLLTAEHSGVGLAEPPSLDPAVELTSRLPATTARGYFELGIEHYRGQISRHDYTDAELQRASELFGRALELDPDLAVAHAELASVRALQWLREGGENARLEAATSAARRALDLDSRLPEAHKSLGLLARLHGRWVEAEAAFERAVELRPVYAAAQDGLATVYLMRGRGREALELRRHMTSSDLPPARILGDLGWTLLVLGEHREAWVHFRAALDYEPFQVVSSLGLARLEVLAGDSDGARRRLEATARAHDRSALVWSKLGLAAQLRGELEQAEVLLRRASQLAGDAFAAPWLRLAQVRQQLGRIAEADPILEGVGSTCRLLVEQGHESWAPRLWIGVVEALMGRPASAIPWLEAALAQGYVDVEWLRDDPLLDAVRNETRFGEMLADLEDRRRRDLGA
ncbi:MAG: winged helix-turn-helix domain-containing protein [Holophagales bacterium]|nr:winged helix-turn-helix domain-containing protein [Holophagales bacterium]